MRNNSLTSLLFVIHLLGACEKDCSGTYEFKGQVWNGSTNKPHASISLDFVFSKESRGIFSSGTYKSLGSTRTDANGNFSFTYPCQNDEGYVNVSTGSILVGNSYIGSERANANVEGSYNIPDSISIDIYLVKSKGLGTNDTLFVETGIDGGVYESFVQQTVPNGFHRRFRMTYGEARSLSYTLSIRYGVGWQAYQKALSQYAPVDTHNNLIKLEPEINRYTIYY